MGYVTEGVPEFVKTLFPIDFKGIGIDVGAYHSTWINNTWILEQAGWDIYCIEPNPHCLDELKANRKKVYPYAIGPKFSDDEILYIIKAGHGPNGEAGGTGLLNHKPEGELGGSNWSIPKGTQTEQVKTRVRPLDWF
jgi:hypothetical protein